MTVTHVCGGSEGCMCFYDPKLNDELKVGPQLVQMDEIERVLREVDRDFAGAHVNAGVVVGAVSDRLKERFDGR